MTEAKKSIFTSVWFHVAASVVALVMVAEYARLVLGGDDSTRRLVVLGLWIVIALGWIAMTVVRIRRRRREG
jgi:hypothetical protein